MAESVGVSTKRPRRRFCEHCNKELSIKIFREHKRLYYNSSSHTWVRERCEERESSSSEITSVEEYDFTANPCSPHNRDSYESEVRSSEAIDWDDCSQASVGEEHTENPNDQSN